MYGRQIFFIIASAFAVGGSSLPAQSPETAPAQIQTVLDRLLPVAEISRDSIHIEMLDLDTLDLSASRVTTPSGASHYLIQMGVSFFLSEAEDETTLAGLLAHELAHIKLRHADLPEEEYLRNRLKYEIPADSLAIALLASAGYNAKGFVGFLSKSSVDCARALEKITDEEYRIFLESCVAEMRPRTESAKRVAKEVRGKDRLSIKSEDFRGFRNVLSFQYLGSLMRRDRPSVVAIRRP